MIQWFLQGSLVNTLCAYLCKLELPKGPLHTSSWRHTDDSGDKSDDDHVPPSRSYFHSLIKSKYTASLQCSSTTQSIHKIKVDFLDPSASIKTPDSMSNIDILWLCMYTAACYLSGDCQTKQSHRWYRMCLW